MGSLGAPGLRGLSAVQESSVGDTADLAQILAALPVGVVRIVDGKIAFANDEVARIFGEPAAALVGRDFLSFVDPSEREQVAARHLQRLRGERAPEKYVVTHLRPDGARRRVEVEPRATGRSEAISVLRDVTDFVQESALVAALTKLAAQVQAARSVTDLFSVACEGLVALGMSAGGVRADGDDLVLECVALRPMPGVELADLLGRPLAGLRFPRRLISAMAASLDTRQSQFHEDVAPLTAEFLGRLGVAPQARFSGDTDRLLFAPLIVRDRAWGLLAVTSPAMSADDAAALTLFAAQISSTLEVLESLADLQRTNRDIAAIHAVAQTTGDAGAQLPRLAAIAASASSSDFAALLLVEEDHFVVAAQHGYEGETPAAIPRSGSLSESVLSTAAPRTFVRIEMPESEARKLLDTQGFEHLLLVPLALPDRPVGVLLLARRDTRPYRADDVHAAATLASQLTIQVENARLVVDASRRVSLLQVLFALGRVASEVHEVAPLAERVVLLLGEALSADGARLYLAEPDHLALASWREIGETSVAMGGVPLDESTLVGRVALSRRPERLDWRHAARTTWRGGGVRHEIAAPLVAGDRLVGVLSLLRRSERPFVDEELGLLESSAAQTALAIERARLFEGAQRRVDELQLLVDVGHVITASLDLEQVLEQAAGMLAKFVDASDCYILLLDPGRPVLSGAACSSDENRAHFRTVRIRLDEPSIAARAVTTKGPVSVRDTTQSADVNRNLVTRYGEKSLLALPLMVRDQPIGCVVLDDTRVVRTWTEAEIQRASLIVNQVGVAVSNARLYEDLKRSYSQLAHAQEELVKRERLAALGELAAVVAHEVRNPVAVIFNALSALRKLLKVTGDAAMLLGIVGEEADRLNRIVGDLLDFARPSEPALAPESLGAVIHDTVEAASSEPAAQPVQIRTELSPGLPEVRIDARMLRQALLNVVVNGLQAMPRGGVLTVAAGTTMSNGKRWARVDVLDTGPGVPPELATKIFQPFFTTKATGTGLGLAVVKRIMEAHHGEITVESRAGEGTRVSLLLPMEEEPS